MYHEEDFASILDGWYLGETSETCNDVCDKNSLSCSEDQLLAYNSDVDSSDKVIAIVQSLGGSISNPPCKDDGYGANDDVPNINGPTCYYSRGSRGLSTFSCSRNPGPDKQRLCYCLDNSSPRGNFTKIKVSYQI